jgi:hypothetical protein
MMIEKLVIDIYLINMVYQLKTVRLTVIVYFNNIVIEIGVNKDDIEKIKLKYLNMKDRENLFIYAILN